MTDQQYREFAQTWHEDCECGSGLPVMYDIDGNSRFPRMVCERCWSKHLEDIADQADYEEGF